MSQISARDPEYRQAQEVFTHGGAALGRALAHVTKLLAACVGKLPDQPPQGHQQRTPRQKSASHRAASGNSASDSQGNSDFRKITRNLSLLFNLWGF